MTALRVAQAIAQNGIGIVASSLDTNGYVRFKNGLVIQWGLVLNIAQGGTVALPIAVSNIYSVLANDVNSTSGGTAAFSTYNYTTAGFNLVNTRASDRIYCHYIAICQA